MRSIRRRWLLAIPVALALALAVSVITYQSAYLAPSDFQEQQTHSATQVKVSRVVASTSISASTSMIPMHYRNM